MIRLWNGAEVRGAMLKDRGMFGDALGLGCPGRGGPGGTGSAPSTPAGPVEGTVNGAQVDFGSFAVPLAGLENASPSGKATFSVRPQSMRLSRTRLPDGVPQAAVTIAERAYLGEFWDYVVAPNSGTRLRVTAPPLDIYEVGESAWLAFDPKQMTPIS